MNTLETITIFPDNKQEIERYKANLKSEILNSTGDPLVILKKLKYVEKAVSDILKDSDIEDRFLNEALLYEKQKGTSTFEHAGCKFTVQEVGTKYDYSSTGDTAFNDLNAEMDVLKEKIKAREEYLKAIPDEGTVDPVNGNFLRRPVKMSKTKVVTKL